MDFWSSDFLIVLEDVVFARIETAQYKINDIWYDCLLVSNGEMDGYRYFRFEVPSSAVGTITGLRFIDETGDTLGEKAVNVIKTINKTFNFRVKYRVTSVDRSGRV